MLNISASHVDRIQELERRKKRLQTQKRVAKKGASLGDEDEYEVDLDLTAETDAIRAHLEQLKK